jgi:hypothetical protein
MSQHAGDQGHQDARAMSARPNFLVIGAAKAGTTALYDYLAQHPEIHLPRVKEPHFLGFYPARPEITLPGGRSAPISRNVVATPAQYQELFVAGSEHPLRGDCSASTLYLYQRSIENIAKFCDPSTLMIAILRHPVDRAYSSFNHSRRRGFEPSGDFGAALAGEQETLRTRGPLLMRYLDQSRYVTQVKAFLDAFGRDRMHFVLYDDFVKSPRSVLGAMMSFLGADPSFEFQLDVVANASVVPKGSDRWATRAYRRGLAVRPVAELLPPGIRRRLGQAARGALTTRPEPLRPDLRNQLTRQFAPEVTALADLIGRDLSSWLPDNGRTC